MRCEPLKTILKQKNSPECCSFRYHSADSSTKFSDHHLVSPLVPGICNLAAACSVRSCDNPPRATQSSSETWRGTCCRRSRTISARVETAQCCEWKLGRECRLRGLAPQSVIEKLAAVVWAFFTTPRLLLLLALPLSILVE